MGWGGLGRPGVGCSCRCGVPLSPPSLTAGLPLVGSTQVSCKQPISAAVDSPHLMPVEHGLPCHLVAMGLGGQAIPCVRCLPFACSLLLRCSLPPSFPCYPCHPSLCLCLASPPHFPIYCCYPSCPSWCGSHVLPCCAPPTLVRWCSTFSHAYSCPCPMQLSPCTRIPLFCMVVSAPRAVG